MAKNRHFANGRQIAVACTDPAVPASGDPVLLGQQAGVALENERADGLCSIDTAGVYDVSVKAINAGGNSAVAAGDLIYYTVGDTPPLSKKATGVKWGVALATVTTGATATIAVKVLNP